jgi:hypothetical protein
MAVYDGGRGVGRCVSEYPVLILILLFLWGEMRLCVLSKRIRFTSWDGLGSGRKSERAKT